MACSDGDWRSAKGRGGQADPSREWQQMGQQIGPRQGSMHSQRDQPQVRLVLAFGTMHSVTSFGPCIRSLHSIPAFGPCIRYLRLVAVMVPASGTCVWYPTLGTCVRYPCSIFLAFLDLASICECCQACKACKQPHVCRGRPSADIMSYGVTS